MDSHASNDQSHEGQGQNVNQEQQHHQNIIVVDDGTGLRNYGALGPDVIADLDKYAEEMRANENANNANQENQEEGPNELPNVDDEKDPLLTVRFADHLDTLRDTFQHMRERGILCDANVVVRNRSFPAHKAMLVSFSAYFRTLILESRYEVVLVYSSKTTVCSHFHFWPIAIFDRDRA